MLPTCLLRFISCRDEKAESDHFGKPTNQQVTDHFLENRNQVAYLLSVKNQTRMNLIGSITDFKTNLINSRLLNEDDGFKVLVDMICRSYDVDYNGQLDKKEMKTFVKDFLPHMLDDFKYDSRTFNTIFKKFDIDGNGLIEKDEMGKKVYKRYTHFKEQDINYHKISEKAYKDTRELD